MEIVEFGGWKRCARLASDRIELIVTLDVGPRVIRFGFVGGPNEFVVHEKDAGHTGGPDFHSYGGHRLWIAPEVPAKTLQPDNEPVEAANDGDFAVFRSPNDVNHLQKEIAIRIDPASHRTTVRHRIYNHGAFDCELAAWTPTQMETGGVCLFPQHPFRTHADQVLPARPLVLWTYTKLADARWSWGDRVVRLRHDGGLGPTKIGALVQQGYAAYAIHGNLFVKTFDFDPNATYPDFGCNFEAFTREDMLEVESLGPVTNVAPGSFCEHVECWSLLADHTPPADDTTCADWLERIVAGL